MVNHEWLKAKWSLCLLRAVQEIERRLAEINKPYLVLHGEHDSVINTKGCLALQEKSTSLDKTLKIMKGGFHSLHKDIEPTKTETLELLKSWLSERVAQKSL